MDIEKLNDLQKMLEILRTPEFMTDKETYERFVSLTREILDTFIKSLDEDTDKKLVKFLAKLDKNLKAIILAVVHPTEDYTLIKHKNQLYNWVKYYEDKLNETLKQYE